MSSLHGLPPLPKSLSGFNLNENFTNPPTPARTTSMRAHQGSPSSLGHMMYTPHTSQNGSSELAPSASGRKLTNLDAQLAILRREMMMMLKTMSGCNM
ncbi:hypothetical protein WA026_015559 [Henosepilachna vigintioctopunctata]|uniref:Uncharacterized protein n=1 Tax=Henosepilachna vigintioctopunctata TaxID=420089 RepID=A0AAW1VH74_9CUCU